MDLEQLKSLLANYNGAAGAANRQDESDNMVPSAPLGASLPGQSPNPNLALAKGIDSLTGMQKTQDSITPTTSPIDLAAGGLGAKLGSAMAGDVGSVLGNNIGAVGRDIADNETRPGLVQQAASKLSMNPNANSEGLRDVAAETIGQPGGVNQNELAALVQAAGRTRPTAAAANYAKLKARLGK